MNKMANSARGGERRIYSARAPEEAMRSRAHRWGGSGGERRCPEYVEGYRPLIKKVSQLFVWGFEGTTVSKPLRQFLKAAPPAGAVLFRRNLESRRQIQALTQELQRFSRVPLLIGIDEEGGRVSRLPEGFIKYPPAQMLGRLYQIRGGEKALFELGRSLARGLLSVGINTNFAPVLDVDSNPRNPIIGDRAFSGDPEEVVSTAIPFFLGMEKEGLISCGKHFPGHGDTRTDSHLTLPHVSKERQSLKKIEFPPFQEAIRKKIPMLMTAHVVYEALDRKKPATLSATILKNLLRTKMRFRGVVISDDLHMKAISRRYSIEEASLLSLEAGVDLLLVCQNGERGREVVEEVAKRIAVSPSLQRRVDESFVRISRMKKKYLK